MFTASSSRASSARAAVVERLRRVLFSPQRLLSVGTLTCVLACGGFAVGQDSKYVFTHKPTAEDATNMVQVEDGNEIPTYFKSYDSDDVAWDAETQLNIEGLFYKALAISDAPENAEDKQRYQLVYVAVEDGAVEDGKTPDLKNFASFLSPERFEEQSAEDQKAFKPFYVEYEIDAETGLRKLYSETEVKNAETGLTLAVGSFNETTSLSTVRYNQNLDGQSIVKTGGGQAYIMGAQHVVGNLSANGGSLAIAASGDVVLEGIGVVERKNDYDDLTLSFRGANITVAENAILENKSGLVGLSGANINIDGAYISSGINADLGDAQNLTYVTDKFKGRTTVGSTGKLMTRDAGFNGDLFLESGSVSALYHETSFGEQLIDADTLEYAHSVDVKEGATLYAGAGNLDNTPVNIDGEVFFIDVNMKDEAGEWAAVLEFEKNDNGEIVDVNGNGKIDVVAVKNEKYKPTQDSLSEVTTDENGVPTALISNNSYAAMVKSVRETESKGNWKDSVNSSPFTGDGVINIEALFNEQQLGDTNDAEYLNKYFQTDFFTVFNGDKSGFSGDTNVKFGSLVLTSSSYNDAQAYKEKRDAQVTANKEYEDAKTAYKNAVDASSYADPNDDPEVQAAEATKNAAEKEYIQKHAEFLSAQALQEQAYGSTSGGVFTVFGKEAKTAVSNGANGRLLLWRDSLNGELSQADDAAKEAYDASLTTAPVLSADKIDFQGAVVRQTTTDEAGNPSETIVYKHGDDFQKDDGSRLGAQIVFNTAFKFQNEELDGKSNEELRKMGVVRDGSKDHGYNQLLDIRSDRTLATLNANEIAFSQSNYIWYDGVSQLDVGAKLTVSLNAPEIKVYTADALNGANMDSDAVGNYYLMNSRDADASALESVFDKPLVNAQAILRPGAEGDDGAQAFAGYDVQLNAINVADFAQRENLDEGSRQIAEQIDAKRPFGRDDDPCGNNRKFFEALYNEDDENKVKQTLHNVSLLGHSMLNMYGHFGNPTSPFFAGSAISAASKRGQEERVVGPLEEPQESAIEDKKEEDQGPTRGVWASYTFTNVQGEEYMTGVRSTPGYDLYRSGIIGGVKRQYDATLSGGLFFGLTLPEIESVGAINGGSMRNRMEMTDFQFAGHLEKIIEDNWELCLFAGGGAQSMEWEREVTAGGDYRKYTSSGSGNTLTGTAYLAYRVDLGDQWTLRPTIGVDSEHSWLYAFDEVGSVGQMSQGNELNQILAQTYSYKQTYYNRNLARAGLTLAYDGAQGWAGLNGRAFYSTQLGGKPSPLMAFRTTGRACSGDVLDMEFRDISTHAMGSDAFSVGGGGYMHLNREKTFTATADVNSIWYKNATTLNVTGGVSYRF